jgi:hypothetical protein
MMVKGKKEGFWGLKLLSNDIPHRQPEILKFGIYRKVMTSCFPPHSETEPAESKNLLNYWRFFASRNSAGRMKDPPYFGRPFLRQGDGREVLSMVT